MSGREGDIQRGDYTVPAVAPVARTVPEDLAGLRIDLALARMFPEYSRSRLQSWLQDAHILLDGRTASADQKVWGGEHVRLAPQPTGQSGEHVAEPIRLSIIYQDECIIVVDKPASLVVHPGSGNWTGTLLNALLHLAPELSAVPRAGIVHRLDKDTSGLIVIARTIEAQTDLVRQLQARTVRREYLALAHGLIGHDGEVEAPIGRDPRLRTRMAVTARGKPALTRYRVLECYREATLLECLLSTGRTHQIRVHLHSIGHPLVGDQVYRGASGRGVPAEIARFPRQALHAIRLSFLHPVKRESVLFESPVPGDIATLLAALR